MEGGPQKVIVLGGKVGGCGTGRADSLFFPWQVSEDGAALWVRGGRVPVVRVPLLPLGVEPVLLCLKSLFFFKQTIRDFIK